MNVVLWKIMEFQTTSKTLIFSFLHVFFRKIKLKLNYKKKLFDSFVFYCLNFFNSLFKSPLQDHDIFHQTLMFIFLGQVSFQIKLNQHDIFPLFCHTNLVYSLSEPSLNFYYFPSDHKKVLASSSDFP